MLMSVTSKFSKRITLIKEMDNWPAKQWAYTFLKHLYLIDWGLFSKQITDHNLKFLSAFCTTLFTKLEVKLLYSIAYHSQTNGSSEHTNKTVEIAYRFFVHALEDPFCWPKVLLRIQDILNNTLSSTTGKISNKIAYRFSLRRPLDWIFLYFLRSTYVAQADTADAIFFALANQKAHNNRKQQSLFMKVGDWVMLKLHKSYSIPSLAGVTKKLTQQFIGLFRIEEKVRRFAYRLAILGD